MITHIRTPINAVNIQKQAMELMGYFHFVEKKTVIAAARSTKRLCRLLPARTSMSTLQRWFKHYLQMGLVPATTHLMWGRKWKTRGAFVLYSAFETDALLAYLEKQPILYLDEMVAFMKIRFDKPCSLQCMSSTLRRIGLTRKKVYEKASQALQVRKDVFVSAMRSMAKKPEMLLFIDESSKDRLAARRTYGWSKVGTRVNYRAPFNMDIRYTLIGAADCFGFVQHMCEVVMHHVDGKEESNNMNGDKFVEYITNKVAPCLGSFAEEEAHSIVIMDNCSIHMRFEVAELIQASGAVILYSAPYSPELIPIEAMFKQWKDYLKRNHVEFGRNWRVIHDEGLNCVSPVDGLNYFKMTTLVELVENHPLIKQSSPATTVLFLNLIGLL
jgi:transposase